MSKNAGRLANLTAEEKRALLASLLEEKAKQPIATYPLSQGQRALWFLHQLSPNNAGYNEAFAWRIRWGVDLAAFQAVFQVIADRHPLLRTDYGVKDGEPVQRVRRVPTASFAEIDASGWNQEELVRRLTEEAHAPFDLEHGPISRIHIFRRSPEESILLTTIHHVAIDLWSMVIVMNELQLLYGAQKVGLPLALPPLQYQYKDYVQWQKQMLAGPEGERHWSYWKRQLGGELPALNLPTDRPRRSFVHPTSATQSLQLSDELTEKLKSLALSEKTTLYTLLLAAFQVLLGRLSGQDDILVGSLTSGRTRPEWEGVVGYFGNPVALRGNLSGNPTFRAFLAQARQSVHEAMEHQDYPFALLVERLLPIRDLSRPPMCSVSFILQSTQRYDAARREQHGATAFGVPSGEETGIRMAMGGAHVELMRVEHQLAWLDLELEMFELGKGLAGSLRYNTDLFDATTIERFVGQFERLLQGIVDSPGTRLSELPVLTDAERRQLLREWSTNPVDYRREQCIHQVIEAQAERLADAIALVFEDQRVSYRELNERSNQLAHYLRSQGVGPEIPVGISIERLLEMIIAVLAVLKAGGAYLPLVTDLPRERMAFMLADSGAKVLLTQDQLVSALPRTTAQVICLDGHSDEISRCGTENPISGVTARNLAYILYTSGSTGAPKGTLIEHRGLTNLALAMSEAFDVKPGDRALQFSPLSFDASTSEIVVALASGATLCLARQDALLPGRPLLQSLRDLDITTVILPPSVLAVLPAESLPALRTLIVAGEACPAELVERWSHGRSFLNAYGPTEATVCATIGVCHSSGEAPSIGKPMANVEAYILDSAMQPVPIGVTGEIYLGGIGVARGYLNRPELTAEKFLRHPFGSDSEARLYRSGDLARWRADGSIEFQGRIDHQVKIRGCRIELGEVEAVLAQHPQVKEAVVVAREETPGDKRLLAYLTPASSVSPNATELRSYLHGKLPDYMVPATFIVLDAMPLTAHGKIDRRALPEPSRDRPESSAQYIAPRDAMEEAIVNIWAEVLGLKRVGIRDNFFELGGHSLLITQLFARIETKFEVDLPLRALFEAPTVEGLAHSIRKLKAGGEDAILAAVDLLAEAVLDPAIQPVGMIADTDRAPQHLLLTGATGFLGAYLLHELLEQTTATIHCLVRASSDEEGRARLQKSLTSYGLWDEAYRLRMVPVLGDLAQPLLGLSAAGFQDLATKTDVIYHNGALVNFIYPYEALKASNVLGTQEVLRLACQERIKPVHMVSTLSVFPMLSGYGAKPISEEEFPERPDGLLDGYSQSKWVAEKLALTARSRGLPVSIYRPGRITADSRSGNWGHDDLLLRTIKDCLQLGVAPDLDITVDMVPVDYVSAAIVQLSKTMSLKGKTYHLANPLPITWNQLVEWFQEQGQALRKVSISRWQATFLQGENNPLAGPSSPLRSLLSALNLDDNAALPNLQFDCRNTARDLSDSDVRCPAMNDQLLKLYFLRSERNGSKKALHNGQPPNPIAHTPIPVPQ